MTSLSYAVQLSLPISTAANVLAGAPVVDDGTGRYVLSTAAARGTKRSAGVVLYPTPGGGTALVIQAGLVPASVAGLGTGIATWVRVSSGGGLERIASPLEGDDVIGSCETDGTLHVLAGLLTAALCNGGGGGGSIGTDDLDFVDVRDFGGFFDGATSAQNGAALEAAIESLNSTSTSPGWAAASASHSIYVPGGIWTIDRQIVLYRPIRLYGQSTWKGGTRLQWLSTATLQNVKLDTTNVFADMELQTAAIVILGSSPATGLTGVSGAGADGTVIENIVIAANTNLAGNIRGGVAIFAAQCVLRNVGVYNFNGTTNVFGQVTNTVDATGAVYGLAGVVYGDGPGVKVAGYSNSYVARGLTTGDANYVAPSLRPTNAALNYFERVDCTANNGDGFRFSGDDGSLSSLVSCRGFANRGTQFNIRSFYNTGLRSCQADAGEIGQGAFYVTHSVGGTVIIDCYAEQTAPSHFEGAVHVYGGSIPGYTRMSVPSIIGTQPTSDMAGLGGYGQYNAMTFTSVYEAIDTHWWFKHKFPVGHQLLIADPSDTTELTYHRFEVTASVGAGLSKPYPEPVWNHTVGLTTTDGDLTWTNQATVTVRYPSVFAAGGLQNSNVRAYYAFGQVRNLIPAAGGSTFWPWEMVPGGSNYPFTPTAAEGRECLIHNRNWPAYDLCSFVCTYPRQGALVLPEVWVGRLRGRESRISSCSTTAMYGGYVGFARKGDVLVNAIQARAATDPWAWQCEAAGALPHIDNNRVGYKTRATNTTYTQGEVITDGAGNVFRASKEARTGATATGSITWVTTTVDVSTTTDGDQVWVYAGVADSGGTTVWKPLPKRAASRANSTAAVLGDLVTDFNDLLQKLRDANVITP